MSPMTDMDMQEWDEKARRVDADIWEMVEYVQKGKCVHLGKVQ